MMGEVQYDDYAGMRDLQTRIALQERLGANPEGWFGWLFDRLELPANCRVLELAAGPGTCWVRNAARIQAGWRLLLTDLSAAMVASARAALREALHETDRPRFEFALADVQAIPSADGGWDAVIANGVFDYLADGDRDDAFRSVARVLKNGGRLYTVAGGRGHLRELENLVRPFVADADYGGDEGAFGLENGAAQLAAVFSEVRLDRYDDTLSFGDAGTLMQYLLSEAGVRDRLSPEARAALAKTVEQQLQAHGPLRAALRKGLFSATADDQA